MTGATLFPAQIVHAPIRPESLRPRTKTLESEKECDSKGKNEIKNSAEFMNDFEYLFVIHGCDWLLL